MKTRWPAICRWRYSTRVARWATQTDPQILRFLLTAGVYQYLFNLINFQIENGVCVIPKILDSGYLAIGKRSCRSRGKRPRSK